MELASDHIRMIGEFCNLNQLSIWRHSRKEHSAFFEFSAVGIVEFKAMTMALFYLRHAVSIRGLRAFFQHAWIEAKPHRPAHVGDGFLISHQVNHRRGRTAVE